MESAGVRYLHTSCFCRRIRKPALAGSQLFRRSQARHRPKRPTSGQTQITCLVGKQQVVVAVGKINVVVAIYSFKIHKAVLKKKNRVQGRCGVDVFVDGKIYRHGKCWRTVFTHELLTYQKSNESAQRTSDISDTKTSG